MAHVFSGHMEMWISNAICSGESSPESPKAATMLAKNVMTNRFTVMRHNCTTIVFVLILSAGHI